LSVGAPTGTCEWRRPVRSFHKSCSQSAESDPIKKRHLRYSHLISVLTSVLNVNKIVTQAIARVTGSRFGIISVTELLTRDNRGDESKPAGSLRRLVEVHLSIASSHAARIETSGIPPGVTLGGHLRETMLSRLRGQYSGPI
jgi:hypothetical protein